LLCVRIRQPSRRSETTSALTGSSRAKWRPMVCRGTY
jgi:hypothetical protein